MSKNFIDRFKEEGNKDHFWSLNKKIGAGLVVFFLAIIMINTSGCTQGGNDETAVNPEDSVVNLPQDTVKVGNDGVNAAIAPDDTSAVANQMNVSGGDTMVTMSVEGMGRSDPFLPEGEASAAAAKAKSQQKPKYPSFLAPPPEDIVVDSTATAVMTTKVSGIMFDKFNPSAILNINNSDYLVRTGDVINGYKVLSIGRETVTVQYGSNVYKASVGEMFAENGLNFNSVSNLNKKFGGNH